MALVALLAAAVSLGVYVRLDGLTRKSFWGDEISTWNRVWGNILVRVTVCAARPLIVP